MHRNSRTPTLAGSTPSPAARSPAVRIPAPNHHILSTCHPGCPEWRGPRGRMAAHSAGALLGPGPPERAPEGFRGSFQATSQCRRPTLFSVRPGASLISGQTKSTGKAGGSGPRGRPVLLPLEPAARLEAPADACGCPDELGGCVPNSATTPKHILLLRLPVQLPTHTSPPLSASVHEHPDAHR